MEGRHQIKPTPTLIKFFRRLQLRELNNKGNLQLSRGNIYRDYHFREVGDAALDFAKLGIADGRITHLAIAEDIICVIYCRTHLIPFTRYGEISACKDNRGRLIVIPWDGDIKFIWYNKFNYSLITVVSTLEGLERITSTEIASIKSGQITDPDELFPDEFIQASNFDIANCRGMICTAHEGVIKVFELCNYTLLFTLPYSSYIAWFPGKTTDMMLYDVIVKGYEEVKCSCRIYCKLDGNLKNQFSLRSSQLHYFVIPCGSDRIVIQYECMQILDISSEIPRVIKTTDLHSPDELPICLDKRRQFICKNTNYNSVTSRYSVDVFNLQVERSVTLRDLPDSFSFSAITKNEDVAIFVSTVPLKININSILTGESLANIGIQDSMSSWNRFQIKQFTYDDKTHDMAMLNFKGNGCIWSNKFFEHY